MKDTLKKISAIAALVVLIASSGLFGVKAQAAVERPSDVKVTVDDTSVVAGGTITVRTTYTSADTVTSVKYEFYNPYAAYDLNLYSYGYNVSPYYYGYSGGIGSFSATATVTTSGASTTVTVPSSAYGNYTVKVTVTNSAGSSTDTASFFVSNATMDTAKPSLTNVSVGIKNDGSKEFVEITATATDAYSRAGQTSSDVAAIQVAFENAAKPGTWTKTVTLAPVNANNELFYGRLDVSSITEPGTYVLNSATVTDTSGNTAKYKKSGSTLQSSSYDTRFFPRNLDKVTFKIGEVTGEPVTTNKDSQTQTQAQATQQPVTTGGTNTSPKTSENGAVPVAIVMLAVMLSAGISTTALMAKKTK